MTTNRQRQADVLDSGPPRDEFAERAVLASVLLNPSIIDNLATTLRPDDLTGPREQAVYAAMLRLYRRGIPADATLLVGELADAGHLDETGDGERVSVGYLERLLHDLLPSAANWQHYADRVLEVSRRRRAYYRGIRLLGAVERSDAPRPTKPAARGGEILSTAANTNHVAYAVDAGKPDHNGKRTIILRHGDEVLVRDFFNPDEHWRMGKFCQAAADNLAAGRSRVPTDDERARWNHETGIEAAQPDMTWLSAKVLAAVQQADGGGNEISYSQLSCAQLADAQYTTEYLIDGALVAGQPCVIAGPKKALKTSFIIDMGMSLATATPFLGKLAVSRAARVGVMSGESGMATIQETAFRVARAKEIDLREISGLIWSDAIPQLGSLPHMDALERFLTGNEIEVLFIDPAYLAMPGGDAGNLFVQGEMLRSMNSLCQDCGAQLVLAHHTRKNVANPTAPAELEDIAWAGFQEWVRQWCLVSRREPYEPGTGEHRLWLNLGGSAGHSALWAVDVSEGVYDGGRTPRRWCVDVMRAEDARQEVHDRQEGEKQAKQDAKVAADHQRLLNAVAKFPEGETLNVIKQRAGLSGARAQLALTAALDAGHIVPCEVLKGGRTTPRDGFRLADGDT